MFLGKKKKFKKKIKKKFKKKLEKRMEIKSSIWIIGIKLKTTH